MGSSDLLTQFCYAVIFVMTALAFFVTVPITVNMAIFPLAIIYIGSVKSVMLLIREKISKTDFSSEANIEVMGKKEAMKFPVIGSAMLLGLYLMIKFFGKGVVNILLLVYFTIGGVESIEELLDTYATKGMKESMEELKK